MLPTRGILRGFSQKQKSSPCHVHNRLFMPSTQILGQQRHHGNRSFGFVKVSYRGLAKNANQLFAACALVNLFLVRRKLLSAAA